MKKITFISILGFFLSIGVIFAANTLLQNIGGNLVSDNDGGYLNQKTYSREDLKIINEGSDNNYIGDFFTGHYYDPVHGLFKMDTENTRVTISSEPVNCDDDLTHVGYKLEGFSYSENLGYMDFNYNSSIYTYVCFPRDFDIADSKETYLGGYAYSPNLGFQNFDGWFFDSSIDICDPLIDSNCINDDGVVGNLTRIEGNTSSQNKNEQLLGQFDDDVKILGQLTKSTLRKEIEQRIYSVVRSIETTNNGTNNILNVSGEDWVNSNAGDEIFNKKVLYIKKPSSIVNIGSSVTQPLQIEGSKTIVVENGDLLINTNILSTNNPDSILGIIVLNGDIYIDPSVTDIHAVIYTNKSVLSYGSNLYTTNESENILKNQLYIHGSIFSENTIGGSGIQSCPYNINSGCSTEFEAQKYDLNYLRRYKLVQPVDGDGNPDGAPIPAFSGEQASTLPNKGIDYTSYPLVIEYNPTIQQSPPPFF